MKKGSRVIDLERQVTSLKKRLTAQHKLRRISEQKYLKALDQLADSRKYADNADKLISQLYGDIYDLRKQVELLNRPWSRLANRIEQKLPIFSWHTLRERYLDWYAVRWLSKERLDAMAQAGWEGVRWRKGARAYLEWDRKNTETGPIGEIFDELSQTLVHYQEGVTRLLRELQAFARKFAARVQDFIGFPPQAAERERGLSDEDY